MLAFIVYVALLICAYFISIKIFNLLGPALIIFGLILFINIIPLKAQDISEMKYMSADELMILGRGFENTESNYTRLPVDMKGQIRGQVWDLGRNSAGIALRFSSNSPTISAKWTLLNNFSMNHMPATGVKGIDLYVLNSGKWSYVGTAKPTGRENNSVFVKNMKIEQREYLAYLPLYDGVTSLEIGVDKNSNINKPQKEVLIKDASLPIVFYGTSITQGGCASRPGMAYPAIIGRLLQAETINLGFSGNARLDKSLALAISRIDSKAVFIDCLPNCNLAIIKDSSYIFIKTILDARPLSKVILVENPTFPHTLLDEKAKAEIEDENREWKTVYDQFRKDGYENIYYVKGEYLIGDDSEATVDGTHMTDLGFLRMAKELSAFFKKISKE